MITNNKEEFMNSVEIIASRYREKSFEAVLNGFMKSIIKKSITIDVPKTLNFDEKKSLGDSIKTIIEKSSKQFIQNSLVNESGALFDVNFAHEIINPANFNESVQKLIAEHIYEESKDRATVLEAEFESGKINNMTSEEAVNYIETAFSNEAFDTKFINGESLKSSLHHLMSIEGEELIESIKADVHKLVNETEAKNSVIREAVSEINEKKAEIEEQINGEVETIGENKEKEESENNTEEVSSSEETEENQNETVSENNSNEITEESDNFADVEESEQATESYKRSDFYTILDNSPINLTFSGEEYMRNYDEDSFSKEAADDILKEFRELDDGINTDILEEDPEILSVGEGSDNCGPDCVTGGSETESAENEHINNDDEVIEIDPEKFKYDEIQPDELSGEALAKEFIPLSLRKIGKRTIHINKKLPLLLALNGERSEEFFNICRNRVEIIHEMLSKEDAVVEDMAKDDINKKLELTVDSIEKIKNDKDIIMNNLGILGILDGKYQRSENPIDNAVKSLIKPEILKPISEKDVNPNKDISIEAYEHELAETFKIAMKISECKNEIAKSSNIIGNKEQLGYLEELLNEKMYSIPKTDTDKMNLEEKINALQSIESMVGLKEAVNLQAFISKTVENNRDRVVLESLKDIDEYGYSYIDEVEKIKSSINTKFKDQFKSSGKKLTNYNFDINQLVDFILEEQDTTKLKSNLFEQVLSKLSNQNEITNSTEGIILYNRAKAITTGYVAATKLGFLRESDKQDIKNYLI